MTFFFTLHVYVHFCIIRILCICAFDVGSIHMLLWLFIFIMNVVINRIFLLCTDAFFSIVNICIGYLLALFIVYLLISNTINMIFAIIFILVIYHIHTIRIFITDCCYR